MKATAVLSSQDKCRAHSNQSGKSVECVCAGVDGSERLVQGRGLGQAARGSLCV